MTYQSPTSRLGHLETGVERKTRCVSSEKAAVRVGNVKVRKSARHILEMLQRIWEREKNTNKDEKDGTERGSLLLRIDICSKGCFTEALLFWKKREAAMESLAVAPSSSHQVDDDDVR